MKKNTYLNAFSRIHGFSLIELAVVMVVTGLLLVGAIRAYTIYDAKSKMDRMNILMVTLDQTLQAYYKAERRFPCPAPLNGSTAGNSFDSENCAAGSILSVAGTNGGQVLIGKIPAATLGLSNDYMRDIHGSYLTYAVTQSATVAGGSVRGAINVREENIDRAAGSSTFGQLVEIENHNNITYLVTSAGPSKVGAYSYEGIQTIACSNNSKESENCDNDGVFLASLLSHGNDSSAFYDDKLTFKKDDDNSPGDARTLRRALEGRDFRRTAEGVEMLADGYMELGYMSSGGGQDLSRLPRYADARNKLYPLQRGDIIAPTPQNYSRNNDPFDVMNVNGQPIYNLETTSQDDLFVFATPVSPGRSSDAYSPSDLQVEYYRTGRSGGRDGGGSDPGESASVTGTLYTNY